MAVRIMVLSALLLTLGCSNGEDGVADELSSTAEAFLRSVYGCAPERLAELANPEVAVSYPVFETLYDTQVIQGMDAVVEFSGNFCRRWSETSLSIDQVISDGHRVVLVWSFSATNRLAEDRSQAQQQWGGISVFSFDDRGRVLSEVGEESDPGPTARMATVP